MLNNEVERSSLKEQLVLVLKNTTTNRMGLKENECVIKYFYIFSSVYLKKWFKRMYFQLKV